MSSSITAEVYGCIRDGDYEKAIQIFEAKLADFPRSRPVLSLLAYCCYHNQEFARAAEFYEELVVICPEIEEYQVYYVQSLVKSGSYLDATRVAASAVMKSSSYSQRMRFLQAHAEMEQGMLSACKTTLSHCAEEDPETILALAAVDFREGNFSNALEKYKIAKLVMGNQTSLSYYMALCHFRMGEHDVAMEYADKIIGRVRADRNESYDSELMQPESSRHESFIVEAFNLKVAICYATKKFEAAKDILGELTQLLNDEDLDNVTIHNEAIINFEKNVSASLETMRYLLSDSPSPPETLGNLITMYLNHGQEDQAAETFETYKSNSLAQQLLPPDLYEYLDAAIISLSCPEDAFSMLETLSAKHITKLKSGKKKIDDAVHSPSTGREKGERTLTTATRKLAALLDCYIPILMLQAKIYWEKKDFASVEKVLEKSAEFCRDHDAWRLNMGHALFAQQKDNFKASIEYYAPLARKRDEASLLKVPAVALANLSVAYAMQNQRREAEAILKTIETEEKSQLALGTGDQTYHACIINLVMGTLYCVRGNFEFGISQICKSLEPFEKNLCPDTWWYAKRCFLALASKVSKLMCMINDDMFHAIMELLDGIEKYGTHVDEGGETTPNDHATIAAEARHLKHIFIKLCT